MREMSTNWKIIVYSCAIIAIVIIVGILVWLKIIDQFLAVNWFTGMSTLITTVLIYFTLDEMKQQRISTYKPVIVLKDTLFKVKWNDNQRLPYEFSIENMKDSNSKNKQTWSYLEAYNIGFGAAQKIQIVYNYDFKKILDRIVQLGEKSQITIHDSNSFVHISSQSDGWGFNLDKMNKEKIDYLLPVNINQNSTKIQLSRAFCEAFFIYLHLLSDALDSSIDWMAEIKDFNKLRLEITYQDMGSEAYKKDYEIEVCIMLINKDAHGLKEVSLSIITREIGT
jgi:hypothetical protein